MLTEWIEEKKRYFRYWLEHSSVAAKGGAILLATFLLTSFALFPIVTTILVTVAIIFWLLLAFIVSLD